MIYLGPPGNLQSLPYMGRGIGATLDLAASVQRSLGGARTVDYVGSPKRTYSMERKYLTAFELSTLESLALGAFGATPYVLIEPWRLNVLTANQSTAGETQADTTGFYAAGNTTVTLQGPGTTARTGQYNMRVAGAINGAGLRLADSTSAATVISTGIPVLPSASYTFSAWLKHFSGTAASTWRCTVQWYDSAGASISATGGTASLVTGSYTQRTLTTTSPSNVAYVIPRVDTNTALVAANTIDVDDLMLNQGTTTTWAMGTGVPKVAFTELSNTYPSAEYHDVSFTLQEV